MLNRLCNLLMVINGRFFIMVNARNKGAGGEREFINYMQQVVDYVLGDKAFELKRNLEQYQIGGCDIVGAPKRFDFVAVEVKRCERLQINRWWRQACQQAKEHQLPVLAYRQNCKPWMIVMPEVDNNYECTKEITLADFLTWYKNKLEWTLFMKELKKE